MSRVSPSLYTCSVVQESQVSMCPYIHAPCASTSGEGTTLLQFPPFQAVRKENKADDYGDARDSDTEN